MTEDDRSLERRDDDAPPPTEESDGAPIRRKRRKGPPDWEPDAPAAGPDRDDSPPPAMSPADFGLGVWPPPKKLPTPEELAAEFLEPSSTKGETS